MSTAIKDSADSDQIKAQFPVDRVKDGAVRPGFEGRSFFKDPASANMSLAEFVKAGLAFTDEDNGHLFPADVKLSSLVADRPLADIIVTDDSLS